MQDISPVKYLIFSDVMGLLIDLNSQIRKLQTPPSLLIDKIAYARDFATISASSGRMSGRTQWILEHATERDLIVVENAPLRAALREQRRNSESDIRWDYVLTPYQLSMIPTAPRHENIYIDHASAIFSGRSLVGFYKWAIKNDLNPDFDHTYFLIG